MLINLVPDFFNILEASDQLEAYRRYLNEHQPVLNAYWHNYILDPDSPHAEQVMRQAVKAQRGDLCDLMEQIDVESIARDTVNRCIDLFEIDNEFDLYLMVGVGGANAGELVVNGRGIAFVCLEHFTGRANPETLSLGLSPNLLPVWIAHEIAHTVRYGSPASQSELRKIVLEMGGYYDYWETGSRATLRELLVNEGLAVAGSRQVAPGFEAWDYLGYRRRQYRRLRELDAFLFQYLRQELDATGLGYRLRYLSGGMSATQRMVGGRVIPERAGYYVGHRMVESVVADRGLARALRAAATECQQFHERASGAQTA